MIRIEPYEAPEIDLQAAPTFKIPKELSKLLTEATASATEKVAPAYRKMVKQYTPALEERGRDIAKAALGAIGQAIFGKPSTPDSLAQKGIEPAPDLVDQFMNPVIDPLIKGAKDVLVPYFIGLGTTTLVVMLGVFMLGRWTKG